MVTSWFRYRVANSRAISSQSEIASLLLSDIVQCVLLCIAARDATGQFGRFGYEGVIVVAPIWNIWNNFVLVHQTYFNPYLIQSVPNDDSTDLSHLIWLSMAAVALKISLSFAPSLRNMWKHVIVPANSLIDIHPTAQETQVVKSNVGIGTSTKDALPNPCVCRLKYANLARIDSCI